MSDFIIWGGNLQEYNGTEKNLVIPNRIDGIVVTSIGIGAFRGKELRSVVIPDTVRAIYDDAFSMNHLSSVTIPNSVEEIFDHAFENNQLTQVKLSKNIITLGLGAFAGNRLSQVSIPMQVMQRGIEMQFQLMQAFDAGVQLEGRDAD
jgi:hypothetical protein